MAYELRETRRRRVWNLIKGAVGRHADMVRLVSSAGRRTRASRGKRVPPDLR